MQGAIICLAFLMGAFIASLCVYWGFYLSRSSQIPLNEVLPGRSFFTLSKKKKKPKVLTDEALWKREQLKPPADPV